MKYKYLLLALGLSMGLEASYAVPKPIPDTPYTQSAPVATSINYVEIDPQAYADNLAQIRKLVGPKVKICAVMKSNAYGHGINNLIDEAIKADINYIAAVDNNEFAYMSKKIKASGKDIHLLRIAPVTKLELIDSIKHNWNVEEIAGSLEEAQMISATAIQMSKELKRDVVVNIHLYIETGMGRMGVRSVSDMKKSSHYHT